MADSRNCKRRGLGESESFKVELCDCGAVHLTIGFATLRLSLPAFRELATTIQGALQLIEVHEHPTLQ
ncbi:MAG TPA: hypothetical protein VMD75_03800 [Candidatus Binataceae bacterium]|nr:hypothetical protein [Candidatus Binataceae bacterium]